LFLRIRAHPRVQCRPLHIPESIPQLSERVESDSGGRTKRLRCQVRRVLTARPASHPSGGIWSFPVSPRCPERRVGVASGHGGPKILRRLNLHVRSIDIGSQTAQNFEMRAQEHLRAISAYGILLLSRQRTAKLWQSNLFIFYGRIPKI
jgi:hypothetical protein